jgi:hypothetical protein
MDIMHICGACLFLTAAAITTRLVRESDLTENTGQYDEMPGKHKCRFKVCIGSISSSYYQKTLERMCYYNDEMCRGRILYKHVSFVSRDR